ncbi:MAG: sulfatase [Desulfosudaceae bacterium]
MSFNTKGLSRHNILKRLAVVAAVLLLAAAGCWFYFYYDTYIFNKKSRDLLETNAAMVKQTGGFNQEAVLNRLGNNPVNEFYFRFDDHVDQAEYSGNLAGEKIQPTLFSLDFRDGEDRFFTAVKEQIEISNGLLIIPSFQNGYIETSRPLNIDNSKISEITFRIKARKSNSLQFGWSERKDADWHDPDVDKVRLDIIPDGSFHEYRVNLKDRLSLVPANIKKLFLQPAAVSGDRVEIDYLRLTSRENSYLNEGFGTSYEKKGNQVRRVIFARAPGQLRYRLKLPDKNCYLSFGCGVMNENDRADFKVNIRHGRQEKTLFDKKIDTAGRWHDQKIDLSAYAGQTVEIIFKADCRRNTIAFWSNPSVYTRPEEKLNIIVVVEDALRSDHMSAYGYRRETTPVKTRWMKNGLRFDNAYAQGTVTITSVPSLMTSLYPTATGVWNPNDKLHENYLTLAEILRNQGFETASFTLNPAAGYIAGLHQGFSQVFDPVLGRAKRLYQLAVPRWIEQHRDRNFFLYLHLLDPHGPFEPPDFYNKWYQPARSSSDSSLPKRFLIDPYWVKNPTIEGRRALYDGEIYYNDYFYGVFLEKLKQMGLYDNTLIIFLSDHGEHLGEHDLWGHRPPGYVQGIKTPLMMSWPGKLPADRQIEEPVQHIDILPTILDLLDIDAGVIPHQGRSLLPLINRENGLFRQDRVAISEEVFNRRNKNDFRPLGSIFYEERHLLCSTGIGVKLFNLRDDPREVKGKVLSGRAAERYAGFLGELQRDNTRIRNNIIRNSPATMEYDPETVQRLKALGYLSGGQVDGKRDLPAGVIASVEEDAGNYQVNEPATGPRRDAGRSVDSSSPGEEDSETIFNRQLKNYINSRDDLSEAEKEKEYRLLRDWQEELFKGIPGPLREKIFRHLRYYPVEEVYYLMTNTSFRHQRQVVLDQCLGNYR